MISVIFIKLKKFILTVEPDSDMIKKLNIYPCSIKLDSYFRTAMGIYYDIL